MILLKNFFIALLSGFFFLSSFGAWAANALMELKVGDPVPDFETGTIDGRDISLRKLKGKIAVVAFWRRGQEGSKQMLSELEQIHQEYRDRGVIVLAINADKASEADIKDIKTAQNLSYLLAGDKNLTIYGRFGVIVLPTITIIGPEGKLAYSQPLQRRDSYLQLRAHLKFLLGEITAAQLEEEINPQKIKVLPEATKKAKRHLNMGSALLDMGMKDKAREELEKAMELDPSLPEPHILLAKIYLQDQDVNKAGVELGRALKLLTEPKGEKLLQGIAHASQGKDDLAMSLFMEVIKENPKPPPEVYYQVGKIYEKRNEASQALASYQRAVELIPVK